MSQYPRVQSATLKLRRENNLEERSLRHRVNVSISVKGIKTWDCTTDGTNLGMEEVLAESDKLVTELMKRYPVVEDGK